MTLRFVLIVGKISHVHSESVEERPTVKTTRDALDVQKVSDSRKARAIVTLILFIIGTAFFYVAMDDLFFVG